MRGIGDNAVDRTDCHAGGFFIKTHTFGAQIRVYFIDFRTKGDRFIRAFRIAHVTVDTVIFN